MGFAYPKNHQTAQLLNVHYQARYSECVTAAAKVAAENPGLDCSVNTQFLESFINAASRTPLPAIDPRSQAQQSVMVLNDFSNRFAHKTLPSYGPQGQAAFKALSEEMQPKGILTPAINLVYDTKKGGLQLGSILGGLGGALMGFMLSGGGGAGWMGLLAIPLLAIAGAVSGKSLANHLSPPKSPAIPTAPAKTPERSPGRQQQAANDVSIGNVGQLPSPALPIAAAPALNAGFRG